jgi:flagellar basal-body rod modification protein FlgD
MADIYAVGKTADPYSTTTYTPEATDRNTLSVTNYFKLLATQLANQNMTDPMDSSDLMNQMSQMAMVQSLTAMTTSIRNSTTLSQQSYAANLIGKQVTLNAVDEKTGKAVQKKGIVEMINLSGEVPTIRIEKDNTAYSLDSIVSVSGGTDVSTDSLTDIFTGSSAGELLLALARAKEASSGTAGTDEKSAEEISDTLKETKAAEDEAGATAEVNGSTETENTSADEITPPEDKTEPEEDVVGEVTVPEESGTNEEENAALGGAESAYDAAAAESGTEIGGEPLTDAAAAAAESETDAEAKGTAESETDAEADSTAQI